MDEIFTQAQKVHIWLGEADEDAPKVLAFWRTVVVFRASSRGKVTYSSAKLGVVKTALRDIFGDESAQPVDAFLRNPWFRRRWIIQEAALGRAAKLYRGYNKNFLGLVLRRRSFLDCRWTEPKAVRRSSRFSSGAKDDARKYR